MAQFMLIIFKRKNMERIFEKKSIKTDNYDSKF